MIWKKLKKILRRFIDMDKKDVYIWYSPATDITGRKLQETLGIKGGKTSPPASAKLVIGWGTKIKETVTFTKGTEVLNHPNNIRTNRNKYDALGKMAAALNVDGAQHIATYVPATEVKAAIAKGIIAMPLIGRRKFHQGGKGFWECPTIAQLDAAIAEENGPQYFQTMIPVTQEYRLHVFNDVVIHAVKKVPRTNEEYKASFVEDQLAYHRDISEKNKRPFDEAAIRPILERQAENACKGGANMVLRSNRLGWKFSIVKKFDKKLETVAVAAVKALGLSFGAVDCCIDNNNNVWIFEVNSGPGLEATSFDTYIAAFNAVIDSYNKPKAAPTPAPDAKAVGQPVAAPIKTSEAIDTARKQLLQEQLMRLHEMVGNAAPGEVDNVAQIGQRLIFGETSRK